MPRYFFHLYDDVICKDDEGLELADEDAALGEAKRSAKQIACAQVLDGHLNLKHRIEVEDDARQLIGTVRFEDVIALET